MNLSRWIVVPIAALFCFAIGYGISALIGLVWSQMPLLVRWGIPSLLVVFYLFDAVKREQES